MSGAILIVAHNNCHLTKRAVESARNQAVPCSVLVINNSSSDGTERWLLSSGNMYMSYHEQLSLSACWNVGLSCLFECNSYDPVLVINNDTEILPNTYEMLADEISVRGRGFVTGVSVRSRE
jgi:GT2 family glycosyltransferase